MSKSIKIILSIFVLVAIAGYLIFNTYFPVVEAIELPSLEEVKSIQIEKEDSSIAITNEKEVKELINLFKESKPTRKWSVNDLPTVREYYVVHISTEDNIMYGLYVYQDNNVWYLEQAYVGIYKLEGSIENKLNKLYIID